VVTSLGLDLVYNPGVDLDLVGAASVLDWDLHTSKSFADGGEDGVGLHARDAMVPRTDQSHVAISIVDAKVKGVEVCHGMVRVAKVGSIIGGPGVHLHAIALHSDGVHSSLLQASDKDLSSDHLVSPDESFRVVRGEEDDVCSNEDVQQRLLELGINLDVEDGVANTDPILEGGMVPDGRSMVDKLDGADRLAELEEILGVEADAPSIQIMGTLEGSGRLQYHKRHGC